MKSFERLGFKPEIKPLTFFQDDYGLQGDEVDGEAEDEDEDDELDSEDDDDEMTDVTEE